MSNHGQSRPAVRLVPQHFQVRPRGYWKGTKTESERIEKKADDMNQFSIHITNFSYTVKLCYLELDVTV